MELVIGNKNYSSWSMRPWVLMRQLGIAFGEVALRFDFTPGSEFYRRLETYTPAAKVPVLIDDGFAVWDTLAIVEYLAERFPKSGVWPAGARDRARARSLCAEMHAGFGALRSRCPQNLEVCWPELGQRLLAEHEDLRRDLARVVAMWTGCLAEHGGPFLFGDFCAADAFYAPVVGRIRSYGLPVPADVQRYCDRVFAAPGVAAWVQAALAEHDFLQVEAPYRTGRG